MNISGGPKVIQKLSLSFLGEENGKFFGILESFLIIFLVKLIERRTTHSGNTTTTQTITHYARKVWVQHHVLLQPQPLQYQPGSYAFPFSFALPTDIPGSVNMPLGEGHAYISFVFSAEGEVSGTFSSNLRGSRVIPVFPFHDELIRPVSQDFEAMITTMCCIDVGSVRMRAKLDRNAYRPGAMATLQLFIDNTTSDSSHRYVSVKLRQTYFATSVTQSYLGMPYALNIEKTIVKNRTPSIPAGDTIHATIPLVMPNDLLPSASGLLVKLIYSIEVVLSVRGSTDVKFSIPINLYVCRRTPEDIVPLSPSLSPVANAPVILPPNMVSDAPQTMPQTMQAVPGMQPMMQGEAPASSDGSSMPPAYQASPSNAVFPEKETPEKN